MSEQHSEGDEQGPMSVSDEDLPDDLRPSDDNPLAQPAGDDVPDDVVEEPDRSSESRQDSE
jgi:hypothetical protein